MRLFIRHLPFSFPKLMTILVHFSVLRIISCDRLMRSFISNETKEVILFLFQLRLAGLKLAGQ